MPPSALGQRNAHRAALLDDSRPDIAPPAELVIGRPVVNSRFLTGGYGTEAHSHLLGHAHRHEPVPLPLPEAEQEEAEQEVA